MDYHVTIRNANDYVFGDSNSEEAYMVNFDVPRGVYLQTNVVHLKDSIYQYVTLYGVDNREVKVTINPYNACILAVTVR